MAETMPQISGKVYITVNGKLLPLVGTAKLQLGGDKRSPVVGNDVHGWSAEVVPARAECTFVENGSVEAEDIKDATDVTVTVEDDTGRARTIANAVCEGDISVNEKGEVSGANFFGRVADKG